MTKNIMIGVDLAKNVFQVHGATMTGEVMFRRKLSRQAFPGVAQIVGMNRSDVLLSLDFLA